MDFQKIIEYRNANNPAVTRMGIFVQEIRLGYARVTKTVGPEDLNPLNILHGGVFFSMADTACGSAMACHGYLAVTLNASYSFFRSANVGDILTAEAREIKSGKTICVYDAQITNQDGTLLGQGTFTFYKTEQKIDF